MHYFVVGANASGKTSLLKVVSERTGIPYVHGTTELMRRMAIEGDYDQLRSINQDNVLEQWGITAEEILQRYGSNSFLLDSHILHLIHGKVFHRDGPWIAKFDALVLVTAPVDQMLQRILADENRDRVLFEPGTDEVTKRAILVDYKAQTSTLFHELVTKYSLPSTEIENATDHLDDAVNAFIAFHNAHTS